MARKSYSNQIIRFDGKNSFVEVLTSVFSWNKAQINFVDYGEDNKQKHMLQLFVDMPEMLGFCENVLSGRFQDGVAKAKADNKFNGQAINDYTSYWLQMGGVKEAQVKKDLAKYKEMFPWVEDGKAISRQLKIQTSKLNSYKWIIRGEYGLGESNDTGLIVPKGNSKVYINIPLTNDNLVELAAMVKAHYNAYLNQYYNKFGDKLFPKQEVNLFTPDTK